MTNLQIFCITVLLGFMIEVNSDCVDLAGCNRARGMCSRPAVKTNCKNMCGVCPSSSKVSKKKASRKNRAEDSQECVDHVNCFNWKKNGFCDSVYRTDENKRKYCPNACNLCIKKTNSNSNNNNGGSKNSNTANEVRYELFEKSLQENMDPCKDFYEFACGKYMKYMKSNPATKGQSFSRFIDHTRKVETQLKDAVFSNSSTNSQAVKLMRQFRDTCMDTNTIETDLTKNLVTDLTALGEVPMLKGPTWNAATFSITTTLTEMNKRSGHNFLFNIEPKSDSKEVSLLFTPMELIIKDANVYTDSKMTSQIDALKVFISDIINRIGQDMGSSESFANVKKAVDKVVDLETELSKIFVSEQMNDPATMETTLKTPKKLSDFTALVKTNTLTQLQLDLDAYLKANVLLADPQVQAFIAGDPQSFIHTEEFFKQTIAKITDVRIFANYLFIKYIIRQFPYLDSRFAAAANRFASQLDGSAHVSSRDQDCFDMVRMNFPLVLDNVYATKNIEKRTETSAIKIMDKMRQAFGTVIRGAKWMDTSDQKYGIRKLGATKQQIGAVDEAKSNTKLDVIYSGLNFIKTDTFLEMAKKVATAKGQIKYSKLVKANSFSYDKSMSSASLGVNFINEQNELFIPAAVLQKPFLDMTLPASVTYGALGFLYGLGLSHGFDENGGKFDVNGVERSWWSKQTASGFKKQRECLVDLYDGETEPVTNQNIDGTKTLTENIADSGAIRGAFQAYKYYAIGQTIKHVPGYKKYTPEQTFFIGYATMMCASLNQTYQADLMKNSDFSPSRFRVNTVLRNYPEFSKAFKCKAGAEMIETPKCSVW